MTRLVLFLNVLWLFLGVGAPGGDVDPADPVLLIANKNGNSVYLVDAASFVVQDSVPTGENPHEVAAAPEARRAYVANYGEGTISVVDVESRTETERWSLTGYQRLHGIEVGPQEEKVYVTAEAQQAVLEIDADSGTVNRTFSTGKDITHMLALSPDGSSLYATSIGSGTLSKFDVSTGTVITHTRTGEGAEGVSVTPDGEDVWVTNRADDTVSLLDAHSVEPTDTLSVEGFPIRVAFSPRGHRALVSAPRSGEVVVFDGKTPNERTRLDVGSKPIGVLAPTRTRGFVANTGSGTVSVIDLTSPAVVDTIAAGQGPDGMAFIPAR